MALAIASVAGAANGAQAADLGGRYEGSMKDEPYAAPAAIWSGLYVGGNIGGLWNKSGDSDLSKRHCKYWGEGGCETWGDWHSIKNIDFSEDDDTTLIGGVHIGYNWQRGSAVYGIEADADFGDGIDYLASVRARLGYAMDSLLLYATAGVAFVGLDDKKVDASFDGHVFHSFDVSGDNKVGAVVGLGAEYKLASNWSVGVEGLYYFFGDSNQEDVWEKYCKQIKFSHDDDNDMFVVRGRISYHFSDDRYDAPLK
jgi:outer membrane immunogenic protein